MKIAILLSGRINDNIEQYINIMSSIVKSNEVDFFISYSKTKNKCLVNNFLNIYKPKKYIENDEQYHDIKKYITPYDNPLSIMYMFQNRLKVIHLFDEYVKETGSTYDILISTRCDLWYFQSLDINIFNKIENKNKLHIINGIGQGGMENCDSGGINDQFALGNYNNISIYLRLYEVFFNMLDNNIILHPETLLLEYLNSTKIEIQRFNMIYNIKRYPIYDMPNVIDCIMFYNELDMLNYRINILKDVVDYFIIVESTHTHQGKEKKLYSDDIKELFETFKDKIIHIIVDDFPHKYPNIDYSKSEQWINENYQRNCMKRGIDKLYLKNIDILIVADLDEIPDPITIERIKKSEIKIQFNRLEMDFYFYNLKTILPRKWTSTKVLTYNFFKSHNLSFQNIRDLNHNVPIIQNGGWHLTFFGDKYFVKNKLESFAHHEFNNEKCTNIDIIESQINNNIVHNGEKLMYISLSDNKYLPVGYEIFLQKYM
jgi:beta-1,4-mannosyl-glycoprotein beta-1,4-N-acetylglucosaminyltransferase